MSSRGSQGVDWCGIMRGGKGWERLVRAGVGGLSRQMSEIGVVVGGRELSTGYRRCRQDVDKLGGGG